MTCARGEGVSVAGALVVGVSVGGVLEGEVPVDGVPRVAALGLVLGWVDALDDGIPVAVVPGDGVRGVAGWEVP